MSLSFSENQIFTNLSFKNSKEALDFLAEQLIQQGCVEKGYKQAIIEREKEYPTGLSSPGVNIAIPHADYQLVKKATVIVGILKDPVVFHSMEDVEKQLDVQIIMMMAIDEPHGQLNMLQKVVSIIQNENLTHQLVSCRSSEEAKKQLEPYL